MIETGVLVWKTKNIKPYQPIFFHFGSIMHKANWRTHVSYGISWLECQTMPRMYAGRWAKLEATGFTRFHNTLWKKSVRVAPPNTVTNSYTRFLPEPQPYLNLMTQTPKYKPYNITLPKYTVLIHWWVVYAILLLCWSTPCFFFNCWDTPNNFPLLSYSQSWHIVRVYPILLNC